MLTVGLTGGAGAGKSTVAQRLRQLGAVVVDADVLAREVLAPGTEALAEVVASFGAEVLRADASLDRGALARIAFASAPRRRALEAITHPRIAQRTRELFAAAPVDAVRVHDVPLLVEKAMGPAYHLVVVVDAPVDLRVARLVQRGLSAQDARARIAAQAGVEQRRAAADVWLENTGSVQALVAAVDELWTTRLVPFERNLRTGTRVERSQALRLVPHDETWSLQAARLGARIAHAAGSLGQGVEHVGSTAVPGLLAKDVIDLQLGVDSLADADQLEPALNAAGYVLVPPAGHDHVHPGVDPVSSHWAKRFYGGTDPGRVVHLHVRVVGGPGWRAALLMRDWWRADAAARSAYEGEKRRLGGLGLDATAYAEAKEPWFAGAVPQALAWADRTGWPGVKEPNEGGR